MTLFVALSMLKSKVKPRRRYLTSGTRRWHQLLYVILDVPRQLTCRSQPSHDLSVRRSSSLTSYKAIIGSTRSLIAKACRPLNFEVCNGSQPQAQVRSIPHGTCMALVRVQRGRRHIEMLVSMYLSLIFVAWPAQREACLPWLVLSDISLTLHGMAGSTDRVV